MAPNIPDRWIDYKPIGKRIEGTRFIAFKVPLREQIIKNVDKKTQLDSNKLLNRIPNLGMIIDLTNTYRYYDPIIFQKEGVDHKKLMIPGHETPPEHLVKRFKKFVTDFIQCNPDNDKLIGVHCTHGVNRTGYLICNYMISEMAIDPNEAINKFARARGYKIERTNYIESLQKLLENKAKSDTSGTNVQNWRIQDRNHCTNWRTGETTSQYKSNDRTTWRTDNNNSRINYSRYNNRSEHRFVPYTRGEFRIGGSNDSDRFNRNRKSSEYHNYQTHQTSDYSDARPTMSDPMQHIPRPYAHHKQDRNPQDL